MSVDRVAGYPDYSSAGTSKFIPEIWSTNLLKKWYDYTYFNEICNMSYEGEIKGQGDKVYIRTIPDVTTFSYQKGQEIPVQYPESAAVELLIDKATGWCIGLDDIDRVQSDLDLLGKWTGDAAQQTKIAIETAFLADVYSHAGADNTGSTAGKVSSAFNLGETSAPVQLTAANVLEYIVDCGTVLFEQNVPQDGRWMILPGWAVGLIKKSDLKDASLTGDTQSIIRNGRIGFIDTFTIYKSNLISYYSTDTAYRALFGTKDAITFATQLVQTDTLKSERTFAQLVRGLQVYGWGVIKPEALGMLYIKK